MFTQLVRVLHNNNLKNEKVKCFRSMKNMNFVYPGF